MSKLCTLAVAAMLATMTLATSALASEPSPAQKAQRLRMAQCNLEAADKSGEERKAFMKTCLSDKKRQQQDKMRACNQGAQGKSGDERKDYMRECLRAAPPA